MTSNARKIMDRLDELIKPLEDHVKKLEKLCEDKKNIVARDFYNYYKSELLQWQEFKVMLLMEFSAKES